MCGRALTLSVTRSGARGVVITVAGEVDLATADDLRDCIRQSLRDAPSVALDLSDVTFFGAVGTSTLLEVRQTVASERKQMRVLDASVPFDGSFASPIWSSSSRDLRPRRDDRRETFDEGTGRSVLENPVGALTL